MSSRPLGPEDAVTLRGRVIRFRFLTGKESTDAVNVFATLRRLVERISCQSASKKEVSNALRTLRRCLPRRIHPCRVLSSTELRHRWTVAICHRQVTEQYVSYFYLCAKLIHLSLHRSAPGAAARCFRRSQVEGTRWFANTLRNFRQEATRELSTFKKQQPDYHIRNLAAKSSQGLVFLRHVLSFYICRH